MLRSKKINKIENNGENKLREKEIELEINIERYTQKEKD